MSKFPNVQHLASWAGICPGNNESAGRQKSTRVTQGNQYLKPMLIECSWCATNIKDCYLRRKYESLIGRRRKKRALVAVAHIVLIAVYHILKDKLSYKDLGYHYLDERKKTSQVKSYIEKLKNLGVQVHVTDMV